MTSAAGRDACWLLRCVGFGASSQQLAQVRRWGYQEYVERLLREPLAASPEPWTTRFPPGLSITAAQMAGVVTWWVQRMTVPAQALREKMTLFWHGFFTSSLDPVFSSGLLLCQNQLLRHNALGRFGDLLQSVSRDPAMMIYLDGFRNRPEHPNENFAREVMELFTVGPGHYSESDLRSAARAFSSWELAWAQGGIFRERGSSREATHVLQRLAADPATARHVCSRLWQFLTALPCEAAELDRLSDVFVVRHGQLSAVLRELLLGEAFRDAGRQRRSIRGPLELLVDLCQLSQRPLAQGLSADGWDWRQLRSLRGMGQMPFLPPSVAGWRQGNSWLDTATLQARLNWLHQACQVHRTWLLERCQEVLADAAPREAVGRLLTLAQQSDAGDDLRQLLEQRYRGPDSGPELVTLTLLGPEVHLR